MKLYVCKRIRLLGYLQERGFNFFKTEQDRTNPNYNVWIFVETPELRDAIESYYSEI